MAIPFPTYRAPTAYELGGGVQKDLQNADLTNQLNTQKVQANQMSLDAAAVNQREEQALNTRMKSLYAPVQNQPQPAPQQAAPMVTPQQPAMAAAPVQAAQTPVQSAPQQAAPMVAQPQAPMVPKAMPATMAAPQQSPVETPEGSPETPVKKELGTEEDFARTVINTPTIRGIPNPLSADFINKKAAMLAEMVQRGEIRPTTAQKELEVTIATNQKAIKDQYSVMKIVAEAREKGLAGDKITEEVAEKKRDNMKENAKIAYDLLKTDKSAAKSFAASMLPGINLDNPKHVMQIEVLARSSKEGIRQEEVKRKDEESRQIKWKADEDTGLSIGVAPDGKIMYKDSEGKIYTSAQYRDMRQQGKVKVAKAGASRTSIGMGANEWEKALGKSDADAVVAMEDRAGAAKQTIQLANQIKTALGDPSKDSGLPFGTGATIKEIAIRTFGNDSEDSQKLITRNIVAQASANMALAEARKNKGQGALSDKERELMAAAASGQIDSWTPREFRAFADVTSKLAKITIDESNQRIKTIGARRGADLSDRLVETPDMAPNANNTPPAKSGFVRLQKNGKMYDIPTDKAAAARAQGYKD